jgi:GNAT superfamily N-acetyltransferase
MLSIVPKNDLVSYAHELFPRPISECNVLFRLHGLEVRGRPFDLHFGRYEAIQAEGRLVWVVARNLAVPIGYSCHWTYHDLHFNRETVGCDDMWFVRPEWRRQGIGGFLKKMGHDRLAKLGANKTSDTIRVAFDHPNLMAGLGFERKGVKWTRDF